VKVCIDAGHGFGNRTSGVYDTGAVHGFLDEADITLQWALTGKWILGQHGIDVFLTRDDDNDVTPVWLRNDIAEEAGCTRLISIHCNASSNEYANGTETYARFSPGIENQSFAWASLVQTMAIKVLGTKDRGVKNETQSQHSSLAVLDFKTGPSCLLELGFISNPMDRALLTRRAYRINFWAEVAQRLSLLKNA